MSLTHYEVLGVAPDSSLDEIKTAFHNMARTCHPDKTIRSTTKNDDDNVAVEQFRRIQQAWEILRDTVKRREYNVQLKQEDMKKQAKRGGMVPIHWDDLEEALDDDTGETIHVYDCRCGEEVIFENLTSKDSSFCTECPGCCFVYQLPSRMS